MSENTAIASLAGETPSPSGNGNAESIPHAGNHHQSVVTCLADIEPERVEWLWDKRIPLGKVTVLDGDPGTGKTTLALDLAARVTTGRPMPDHTPVDLGAVIILTAEDGLADTIRPRLDAMGADASLIFALAIQDADGFKQGITIPDDLGAVRDLITERNVRLVIVDPFTAFLASYIDSNKDHPVRRAMAPLAQLAEETGVAVLLIRHLNKSSHGRALYRGGGSIAIAGAARSVLLAAEDPEDPTYRVLAPVKHNLTAPPPSLRYHLEANLDGASRVIWGGESKHTANVLCAEPNDPDERAANSELADFIREMLEAAPRTVKEVQKAVRDASYDASDKTLQRARRRIGAVATRAEFGGDYVWSLPDHGGHMVDTHAGVSSKGGEGGLSPETTTTLLGGHAHAGQPPVSSMADAEYERVERKAIEGEEAAG